MRILLLFLLAWLPKLGCAGDDSAAKDLRCEACAAGQRCLQVFDGTCKSSVSCVAPGTPCSAPTIPDAPPCGTEISGALTCYGP
ncbi:MAG: hypothetical protein IPI49_06730 [Myxococcales bacterium]|nr:hypothetical protein [Myxococcales bacterium]